MKNLFVLLSVAQILWACSGSEPKSTEPHGHDHDHVHGPAMERVTFQQVNIDDNFWSPKIKTNRISSIRHALKEAEESIEFFDIAAGKSDKEHKGYLASDSDVYKILEGAAYALYHTPDKELEATIDSVIDRIVDAQLPDGYLFSYWIAKDLSQRWTDIQRKHELYCAGHMFEAAVAYYQVTGKRKFLDAAIRFADHIDSVFGPGKREEVPGHQEIELALYKLYEVTDDRKYLNLSIFFIDERGNPNRIKGALTPPEHDPNAGTPWRWRPPSYMQDHLPVTEQYYAIGHAVRAAYMYSAITDIAMETSNEKYVPALDSIWNDIVRKKLYITGGIGTRQNHDEGFGSEYLLPNDGAYCETCSGIALTFWNRRMNHLHGEAKYADLLELTLYNSGISGVSLSGDRFFYTNPLSSDGKSSRRAWFNPPCCPTNLVRFLPEIGANIYGKTDEAIYINQFIGSDTKIDLAGTETGIVQQTNYPWDGKVEIAVNPEEKTVFKMYIRIPGWAQDNLLPGDLYHYGKGENAKKEKVVLRVNGRKVRKPLMENGYAVIEREWDAGDKVQLELPMDIRMVKGNPRIEDAQGKVVLMRGPIVYCIEEVDNMDYFSASEAPLLHPGDLDFELREGLLNGVVVIKGTASVPESEAYVDVTAVPYYAWNNRGQGQMKVWLPVKESNQ